MRSALNLAHGGLGRVAPNPSVGCVLVKDGIVVGRARTGDGGRPHAETQALEMAGRAAQGACAYVTLEPCAHEGKTPSCARLLVDAGVSRVVIALKDPDPRTCGGGVAILQKAGIEVITGVLEEPARALNRGFLYRFASQKRPFITLKTATSLDGKIATSTGQSKWITGEMARKRGHLLRAQHDAIAVGVNTILADKPRLTTRIDGVGHGLIPVVFDTNLRLYDFKNHLNNMSQAPVIIFISDNIEVDKCDEMAACNVQVVSVPCGQDGHVDLNAAMLKMAEMGITRLMVEGGAMLMSSFIRQGLFDQLYWFRSSGVLGADGLANICSLGIEKIDQQVSLTHLKRMSLGQDMLDIYQRKA